MQTFQIWLVSFSSCGPMDGCPGCDPEELVLQQSHRVKRAGPIELPRLLCHLQPPEDKRLFTTRVHLFSYEHTRTSTHAHTNTHIVYVLVLKIQIFIRPWNRSSDPSHQESAKKPWRESVRHVCAELTSEIFFLTGSWTSGGRHQLLVVVPHWAPMHHSV